MIEEWPGISDARRRSLQRVERFLAEHGMPTGSYAFVNEKMPPASALWVIRYGKDDPDGLNAVVACRIPGNGFQLETDGRTALLLLCVIAANPDLVEQIEPSAPDIASVLNRFGIDDGYLKPKVGQFGIGLAIAPAGDGAVVFDVDQRGEVTILCRAKAMPAGLFLKAMLLDRQQGIQSSIDQS